jgi:hypothetical protein
MLHRLVDDGDLSGLTLAAGIEAQTTPPISALPPGGGLCVPAADQLLREAHLIVRR